MKFKKMFSSAIKIFIFAIKNTGGGKNMSEKTEDALETHVG
jgi:hypothetical protein